MKQFTENVLVCPVCGADLIQNGGSLICPLRHTYDISKEGYVNFLTGLKKSGDLTGDSAEMSTARENFLNKDYYGPLAGKLTHTLENYCPRGGRILDICCGSGYYSACIKNNTGDAYDMWAFDLSKSMVRLASKKNRELSCFVANLSSIPVKDKSFDAGLHLFAPFNEKEYSRILKNDGTLISVLAGREHLWELKKAVYDTPYLNETDFFSLDEFRIAEEFTVDYTIHLPSNEDIINLFTMTPYHYKTSRQDKEKLKALNELDTRVSFIIRILKK